MLWSYGITTCKERVENKVFNDTWKELEKAGFHNPCVFIDGEYGVAGNWILSLWKLYILNPQAERFALFQDDLFCCNNLKDYLEQLKFSKNEYWNLYTSESNYAHLIKNKNSSFGFHKSNQLGRGALALVFNREGVTTVLGSQAILSKPQDPHKGKKAIDGTILIGMKNAGFIEKIHYPSLIQHKDEIDSTLNNAKGRYSPCFYGANSNALELL